MFVSNMKNTIAIVLTSNAYDCYPNPIEVIKLMYVTNVLRSIAFVRSLIRVQSRRDLSLMQHTDSSSPVHPAGFSHVALKEACL